MDYHFLFFEDAESFGITFMRPKELQYYVTDENNFDIPCHICSSEEYLYIPNIKELDAVCYSMNEIASNTENYVLKIKRSDISSDKTFRF